MKNISFKKIISIPILVLMLTFSLVFGTKVANAAEYSGKWTYGSGYVESAILTSGWDNLELKRPNNAKGSLQFRWSQSAPSPWPEWTVSGYGADAYIMKNGSNYELRAGNLSNGTNGPLIKSLGTYQGYIQFRYEADPDLDAPIINGTSYYQTNVDSPVSIDTIKSWLTATDNIDGNVTSSIKFLPEQSTYVPSSTIKIGEYTAKFSANDKSNNYNFHTVTVTVYDVTKPSIKFNGELETGILVSKMSNPFTGNIDNLIIVTDNYDTQHSISININQTGDTINWEKPGVYTRTITATDSSGNMSVRDYTVKVIDDVRPAITPPTDPISISVSAPITVDYFLSLFSARDNVDGVVAVTLVDNPEGYFYNKKVPGTYTEQLRAVDTAGNVQLISFNIIVYDDVPPAIFVNEEFLILNIDNVPTTLEGIIKFFQKTGQINAKFDIQYDDFTGNEGTPGQYNIRVMSFNALDEGTEVDIKVRVLDTETSNGMLSDSLKQSFVEKYKTPLLIGGSAVLVIGLISITVFLKNKKNKKKKRRH